MDILSGMTAEEHKLYYLEMSSPAITPPSTPNVKSFDSDSLDDLPPEEHELYDLRMSSPVRDGSDEPHWRQPPVETDPSMPDKYGFCFWDRLPVEIKDIIFEDVFVLNNTIAAVDKHAIDAMLTCRWDVRKRHKKTMMASYWPLTVSKEWHRAYSETFCSLVHFEFESPEHWRSFASHVTFSRFLVSITLTLDRPCSVGPKDVIAACPSLRSLCLALTTCWFSAKIGRDICADPWSESDFQQYAPSRALLRSLRGRSEIAVQVAVVETDRWPRLKEQGRPIFSKNIAEFLRVAEAASKLPKPTSSYPPDPSRPHDHGTCFWDKLPFELMQMVLDLVMPTGQKITPLTEAEWVEREKSRQAALKRQDRTSAKPYPGVYVERFLHVSKIWYQAASKLFYARADFCISPGRVYDARPPYLRSLTTVSVTIYSAYAVRLIEWLAATHHGISRLNIRIADGFFSDTMDQDLSIHADLFVEPDFMAHEPTAKLLQAIRGVAKVAIQPQNTVSWKIGRPLAQNMSLLERMTVAFSKLPRADVNDDCIGWTPSLSTHRVVAPAVLSRPFGSTLTATPSPTGSRTLEIKELPDTPEALSALLETDSAALVTFFRRNQTSLLEYVRSLKSRQAKED
ncbi:hypothetical protein TI39_contig4197g00004 [Zymoseptoria brevis]|uniref:F-box domain-containing protein n=1 Tax=Zymoseptoria brevis TaxID=1047168 RepID=A0A0F4GDX1_9PEZI|nr:hypothetical protein TI39_contig4197g00004 [Zymoseptoria brevis]